MQCNHRLWWPFLLSNIGTYKNVKKERKKKRMYTFWPIWDYLHQFAGLKEVFVARLSPWLWGKELLSCSMTSSNPVLASWEGLDSSSSPETQQSPNYNWELTLKTPETVFPPMTFHVSIRHLLQHIQYKFKNHLNNLTKQWNPEWCILR